MDSKTRYALIVSSLALSVITVERGAYVASGFAAALIMFAAPFFFVSTRNKSLQLLVVVISVLACGLLFYRGLWPLILLMLFSSALLLAINHYSKKRGNAD